MVKYDLLSYDLSTHTGWAFYKTGKLFSVGKFDIKIYDYISNLKSYKDIPDSYPGNLITCAKVMVDNCFVNWQNLGQPWVVTEHTEGSKHRVSQRTLEFIHFAFFDTLMAPVTKYLLNSDWRKHTRCYLSQWPEFQKWNKEVGKAKKKATPNKAGAKVAKIDGKIVSKMDAKKLSMHIAKLNHPDFADRIDSDNIADAVNMGDTALALDLFKD